MCWRPRFGPSYAGNRPFLFSRATRLLHGKVGSPHGTINLPLLGWRWTAAEQPSAVVPTHPREGSLARLTARRAPWRRLADYCVGAWQGAVVPFRRHALHHNRVRLAADCRAAAIAALLLHAPRVMVEGCVDGLQRASARLRHRHETNSRSEERARAEEEVHAVRRARQEDGSGEGDDEIRELHCVSVTSIQGVLMPCLPN